MNKLIKAALLIISLLLVAGVLGVSLLPAAVEALPGQVRGRLPTVFLRAVTTPLPSALPPPAHTPADDEVTISDLIPPTVPVTAISQSRSERNNEISATTPAADEASIADLIPPTVAVTAISQSRSERNNEISAAAPAADEASIADLVPPTVAVTAISQSPSERNLEILATPTSTRHPPLAANFKIDGLEIVPQKLNNCGPATLSINLNYYGLNQTQLDVAGVVKPHYDDRNVSPEELVAYTNERTTLQAALFRGGDLDLLQRLIAAGFPVVIEKGYEPDEWQGWMGHYLTLYGYDQRANTFDAMDTFLGPWDSSGRPVSYDEIEKGWQQFNYTFYIVYRPEQETALAEIIGPIFDNEQLMWQQTLDKARSDLNEAPENAFAWFNLGSSLTRLGQLNDNQRFLNAAATSFDQARIIGLPPRMLWYQFEPYQSYLAAGRVDEVLALTAVVLDNAGGRDVEETYLYRGHARLDQGDPDAARAD
ncbi:MAG: C39 family peptidase, partial [Candidatus Promineifilaceae bacterium]|nr:C39 family peptidase [Candidatus Promineifilaceae bacterium]